jgi:hypothetical protein
MTLRGDDGRPMAKDLQWRPRCPMMQVSAFEMPPLRGFLGP